MAAYRLLQEIKGPDVSDDDGVKMRTQSILRLIRAMHDAPSWASARGGVNELMSSKR